MGAGPFGRQPVRKVFVDGASGGSATEYWETEWLGEVRTFDGITRRLLEATLAPGSRVLESGCGQGEVAAGLASLGHQVVGVDLARRALADCRGRHPALPLVVGDVARLPFADGSFDAVVSLGVVEHFEAGPVDVLRDHARVLAPDGVLFLTVPGRGWYRRWSDTRHLRLGRAALYPQRGRLVANRPGPAVEPSPSGAFHQYEFPRPMIEGLCREAGLRVERWVPFGVSWALGDSPLVGRLAGGLAHGAPTPDPRLAEGHGGEGDDVVAAPAGTRGRGLRGYVRQAVIDEVGHDPAQRALAWAAARTFAHMQLVVARPDPARR